MVCHLFGMMTKLLFSMYGEYGASVYFHQVHFTPETIPNDEELHNYIKEILIKKKINLFQDEA